MSARRLSAGTTRVLRAVVANGARPGYGYLLKAAHGNWRLVADSLMQLEGRWLVRWDSASEVVRPSRRGVDLLRTSAYRDWGLLDG